MHKWDQRRILFLIAKKALVPKSPLEGAYPKCGADIWNESCTKLNRKKSSKTVFDKIRYSQNLNGLFFSLEFFCVLWLLIHCSCKKASSAILDLVVIMCCAVSQQQIKNSYASRCFTDETICINLLHTLHVNILYQWILPLQSIFCY